MSNRRALVKETILFLLQYTKEAKPMDLYLAIDEALKEETGKGVSWYTFERALEELEREGKIILVKEEKIKKIILKEND